MWEGINTFGVCFGEEQTRAEKLMLQRERGHLQGEVLEEEQRTRDETRNNLLGWGEETDMDTNIKNTVPGE